MGSKFLSEAGKVFASRNAKRLKVMQATIAEMLKEIGDEGTQATAATESARDLMEALLRQSDSVDGRREQIRTAIKEKLKDPMKSDQYVYVWLRDFFEDSVIYDRDGSLYQIAYTIDKTTDPTSVILGEPVEVEICYVPKTGAIAATVQESDVDLAVSFVPLVEKAVRRDGTVPLKLIDPGWGTSGYYGAAVLKRDGPKVFAKGLKMYADHPTPTEEAERPERSIKDLAAVLESDARWEDAGQDGPGLYADAKVFEAWQPSINAMAQDIGVSIRAMGKARYGEAEGRKGPIIEAIASAKSADFVTDAGRGGRILSLREAARVGGGAVPPTTTPTSEEVTMNEAEQKALQESVTALQAQNQQLLESLKTQGTDLARLREGATLRQAQEFVSTNLPAGLPELTRARLVESLSKAPVLKDGAIDAEAFKASITEAVKTEIAYLASLTGSGAIRGMGGTGFTEAAGGGATKPEDVNTSLEESFKTLGLSDSGAKIAAAGR